MARTVRLIVKLKRPRNPYVTGLRFRKGGRHDDQRKRDSREFCRQHNRDEE